MVQRPCASSDHTLFSVWSNEFNASCHYLHHWDGRKRWKVRAFRSLSNCHLTHFLFSFNCIYTGNTYSHKINKLQENTAYNFRICARNESGAGPWSEISTFTTSKAPPSALKGSSTPVFLSVLILFSSIQRPISPKSLRPRASSTGKRINPWVKIRSLIRCSCKSIERKMNTRRFITANRPRIVRRTSKPVWIIVFVSVPLVWPAKVFRWPVRTVRQRISFYLDPKISPMPSPPLEQQPNRRRLIISSARIRIRSEVRYPGSIDYVRWSIARWKRCNCSKLEHWRINNGQCWSSWPLHS